MRVWQSDRGKPVTSPRHTLSRKGSATRAAVIKVAAECIAEFGLSRTSSLEITRRSGYTWGVIQHHFGSYNALLLAVVETASARLRDMLSQLKLDEGASTTAQVSAVADVVWDYFQRPEYLGYLEIYLHLLRDPQASNQVREAIRAFDIDVEAVWSAAMHRLFGDAISDVAFQRILFATMRGLAVSRWLNDRRPDFNLERTIVAGMLARHIERG